MSRSESIMTGIRMVRQRGAATVVIAFLLLLVLIGAVSMSVSDSGSLERDAIAEYHHLQALLIAESAVERAYYTMTTLTDATNCSTLSETGVTMTGYGTLDITGSAVDLSGAASTTGCMIRAVGKTTNGQAVRTVDVTMQLATSVSVRGKRVFTCDVNTGAQALAVMIAWTSTSDVTVSSVTFNGSAMQMGSARGSFLSGGVRASAQIYYQALPAIGSQIDGLITMSDDPDGLNVGCVSLSGVDLTQPLDINGAVNVASAAGNATSTIGTSLTTGSSTTASGSWTTGKRILLEVIGRDNRGSISLSSGNGSTSIWNDSSASNASAGSYWTGIGASTTKALNWDWNQSRAWGAAAIAMRASAVVNYYAARISIPGTTGTSGGTITGWREVTAPPP